jgi:hypothetical protein
MMPVYERERDGCVFAWVLAAAEAERARRQVRQDALVRVQRMVHEANVKRLKKAESAMNRVALTHRDGTARRGLQTD